MKRNPMGYLGLIGFVSLLGFVTGNYDFFAFFFFGIFGIFLIRGSDDRMNRHLNLACRNAFMFTMIAFTLTFVYISFITPTSDYKWAFIITLNGTLAVLNLTWVYYQLFGE